MIQLIIGGRTRCQFLFSHFCLYFLLQHWSESVIEHPTNYIFFKRSSNQQYFLFCLVSFVTLSYFTSRLINQSRLGAINSAQRSSLDCVSHNEQPFSSHSIIIFIYHSLNLKSKILNPTFFCTIKASGFNLNRIFIKKKQMKDLTGQLAEITLRCQRYRISDKVCHLHHFLHPPFDFLESESKKHQLSTPGLFEQLQVKISNDRPIVNQTR